MTDEKTATGNVVKNTAFKSKNDWINAMLNKHATDQNVGEVKAVAEVKDKEGKVTTPAVRGKKGKDVANIDALKAIAAENHLTVKDYPNPGMYRMNIGNMLRAAARKRGGLFFSGKWANAGKGSEGDQFVTNDPLTEKRDGTKIAKKAPAKEADTADA